MRAMVAWEGVEGKKGWEIKRIEWDEEMSEHCTDHYRIGHEKMNGEVRWETERQENRVNRKGKK